MRSSTIEARDGIMKQIADVKQKLTGKTLKDFKVAAKRLNVSMDSLVWLLTPVYPSGHVRSQAFSDCPQCASDDGLVIERSSALMAYVPWTMTDKAKEIIELTRA